MKMHGLSNDFVILDQRDGDCEPDRSEIAAMADRKTGIGFDQLIIFSRPLKKNTDAYMRIFNAPDGDEVEACGNATRCVASLLLEESGKEEIVIQTVAGLLTCSRTESGLVRVDMGTPNLEWRDIPLSRECDTLSLPVQCQGVPAAAVNVGNPHCVFFLSGVDNLDIGALGPGYEHDPLFPARTNIEFAEVLAPDKIRLRVWERSTGITAACGSAACATIVAAVRRGLSDRKAEIILDGGSLYMEWRAGDGHIIMTGPASRVYDGIWLGG